MARRNYPWSIPNIKFGQNLLVNVIILIFIAGFYAIMGLMYLITAIIDRIKKRKSKKYAKGRSLIK